MIEIHINQDANLVYLKVMGKIEEGDFDENIGPKIDEYLNKSQNINGVFIDGENFR